jgi:hypothetical protein
MAMPKFTQDQLNNIMEQGMVRQCACPSLLTRLLSDARYLNEYQQICQDGDPADQRVHAAIAEATEIVAGVLEDCLIEVLFLEGWETDKQGGFTMPEHLLQLQMDAIVCEAKSLAQPRMMS